MSDQVPSEGSVVLRDRAARGWLHFADPVETLAAFSVNEVLPLLEKLHDATRNGLYAAGFLAYEAAPALDRALVVHPADGSVPLAWFGIYEEVGRPTLPGAVREPARLVWHPSVSEAEYGAAVDRIRAYIAAGDTYQVNFSYRLRTRFISDPWAWFTELTGTSPPPFAAYVETGRFAICSLSPELFFERHGGAG